MPNLRATQWNFEQAQPEGDMTLYRFPRQKPDRAVRKYGVFQDVEKGPRRKTSLQHRKVSSIHKNERGEQRPWPALLFLFLLPTHSSP
jgi:hypothetical protein